MSKIQLQERGEGYHVAAIEDFSHFEGKAFVKECLETTAVEVSIGTLAAGEAVPFLHKHRQNEELYIFLRGEGLLSIDGKALSVRSGSLVRIAPPQVRGLQNTGTSPLLYLCIQGKVGLLEQYTMTDGVIIE